MTPELQKKITKEISFAIGLCGSVKPENQAICVMEALLEKYEITPKTEVADADKNKTQE